MAISLRMLYFFIRSLAERIKGVIVEQLGVNAGQIMPNVLFIGDLSADSLDVGDLTMAFKEDS